MTNQPIQQMEEKQKENNAEIIGEKTTFQDLKNELFKCLEGRSDRKIATLIFKQYRIDSIQRNVPDGKGGYYTFEVNYSNKNTKEKHKWTFI